MRQPSLFNFKPTERLRHSGFTPEEERELIMFCLSDDYPRSHTIERTGRFEDFNIIGTGKTEIDALRDADRMTLDMNQLCRDAITELEGGK